MKRICGVLMVVLMSMMLMVIVPAAYADGGHHGRPGGDTTINQGGDGGRGGRGGDGGDATSRSRSNATSGSSAIGTGGAATAVGTGGAATASPVVNTTVAPSQTVTTGPATGGSSSSSVSIKEPVQDRIPGLAVAPGLTSVGSRACLGSWSMGLSGPMAGLSFGKTSKDEDCTRMNFAEMLHQWGHRDAALRLLAMNDEVRQALYPTPAKAASSGNIMDIIAGIFTPTKASAASVEASSVVMTTSTTVVASVPSSTIESEVVCDRTQTKVKALFGGWFCADR